MTNGLQDRVHVGLGCVEDSVGAGIVGVSHQLALALALGLVCTVQLLDQLDNGTADVVHVENGWSSVEAASVEVVRVGHGDFGKSVKVALLDGFRDLEHAFGDDGLDAVLEQRRSLDGALHASGGRGALFGVADDTDERLEVGPVRLGSHLNSETVSSGRLLAALPSDVAAKEGAAGRPTTLTSNARELGAGYLGLQLVQCGERGDEGGESRGRRSETSGSGEVVLRAYVHGPFRELSSKSTLALDQEWSATLCGPLCIVKLYDLTLGRLASLASLA